MSKTLEKTKSEKIKETAETLGVDLILLFGSRADGSNRKDSDFDIAYLSKKPLDSRSESRLFSALAEYAGSDNLQVVSMKGIKPLFLYEIMRNCKVLFAEDMLKFYQLRAYSFNRFQDEVKPLFKMKFDRLKAEYLSK